jgi:hypothetical protein
MKKKSSRSRQNSTTSKSSNSDLISNLGSDVSNNETSAETFEIQENAQSHSKFQSIKSWLRTTSEEAFDRASRKSKGDELSNTLNDLTRSSQVLFPSSNDEDDKNNSNIDYNNNLDKLIDTPMVSFSSNNVSNGKPNVENMINKIVDVIETNNSLADNQEFYNKVLSAVKLQRLHYQKQAKRKQKCWLMVEIIVFMLILTMTFFFVTDVITHWVLLTEKSNLYALKRAHLFPNNTGSLNLFNLTHLVKE